MFRDNRLPNNKAVTGPVNLVAGNRADVTNRRPVAESRPAQGRDDETNKLASLVGVLAAIAAISLALIANPTRTSADAGDPVSGTIQSTQVTNGDGTVTVYVRGQWVWTAHNSDCNTDRAGAGVAIAWNDPSEPGYSLTGKSTSGQTITLGVGVQTLRTGDTHNTVDEMVHPADVGNMASSLPGYNGQLFKDPSPPTPNSYQTWNGGCGSEPLPNGHPGGSWG
jgi:hypothetical protein